MRRADVEAMVVAIGEASGGEFDYERFEWIEKDPSEDKTGKNRTNQRQEFRAKGK